MKTRSDARRVRFPALREDSEEQLVELVFHDEDDAPCSEYSATSREYDMPALDEYLHERGAWLTDDPLISGVKTYTAE